MPVSGVSLLILPLRLSYGGYSQEDTHVSHLRHTFIMQYAR